MKPLANKFAVKTSDGVDNVANEIIKVIRPHTYKRLIEKFDFKRNLSCVEKFLIFNPEDLSLKIEANKHEVIESCIDNLEFSKSTLGPEKEYLRNFKNFKITSIYDLFNRPSINIIYY